MPRPSDSPSVLIVDDEPRYIRWIRINVEDAGYRVTTATTGLAALREVERGQCDLILLDVGLPDIDGFELCARIREFSSVPIIFLTARAEESDKVRGLDIGGDDYLTKPFGVDELLARVRASLRRANAPLRTGEVAVFHSGDLTINFAERAVSINEKAVELSPTEYRLLYHLAQNAGHVMVPEELLERVWGPEYRDEPQHVRLYVRRLRQKLGDDADNPRYIVTRPGVGYMLANR